jgi:hypothetical protein
VRLVAHCVIRMRAKSVLAPTISASVKPPSYCIDGAGTTRRQTHDRTSAAAVAVFAAALHVDPWRRSRHRHRSERTIPRK